jgi:multidrug resistance efflux pump
LAGLGGWYFFVREEEVLDGDVPLYTVRRGPLRATVLEGGNLEALTSHTVVSMVEGRPTIQFIVEEGSVVTAEDVEQGRVLVRLDSAELEEKIERQKIDVAQARSSHENAVSNLEIQRQQNASDIRKAELDVRFARLDLARYVGRDLVEELLTVQHADEPDAPTTPDETPRSSGVTASMGLRRLIQTLLRNERLEGEAMQTIRLLDSDISLAEEEFTRAQVEYDWSTRLREKGFVSRDEEEADRLALERRRIELDRARTAQAQFAQYDFPKQVEQLLSNLLEAEDRLSRTMKRARSAETTAETDVESRTEQRTLQEARLVKLQKQLEACVIRADRPGLVVYASSGRRGRRDRGERIQEGTSVQERQAIIEIPDMTQLGVRADIHESVVERVQVGQTVTAIVDALPDQPLPGRVASVAPLPNPAESWFNPDRKVYATTITLDDVPPSVRPGMSVQVEILVAEVADVVLLPVQAVAGTADRPVAYLADGTQRPLALGLTNDRFVEVQDGLDVGDEVLLAPPRSHRFASGRGKTDSDTGAPPADKPVLARPAGKRGGSKPPAGKPAEGGAPAEKSSGRPGG